MRALGNLILGCGILLVALSATAELCSEKQYPCPVCGQTVTVCEIVSWGSYVYDRPSKYDLIPPPYADEDGFWMCGGCGYAQTAQDFLTIEPDDARRLRQAFEPEWTPVEADEITLALRLERTLRTNELLGRDDEFWLLFYRVLAYNYQGIDPDKAREFVEREIELLESGRSLGNLTRKQRLYVLGEYHRRLGNVTTARRYLASARRRNPLFWLLLGAIVCVAVGLAIIIDHACRRRSVRIALFVFGCLVVAAVFVWAADLSRTDPYMDNIIKDRLQLIENSESRVP